MKPPPQLVVISAPSGAGKTTICKKLLERNNSFKISISATTRTPRQNEVDGRDYFFLSPEEFQRKIEEGAFLEYEPVHGYYYGTLQSVVEDLLNRGYTVLFDIDVNGALKLKKKFSNSILIFIKPPSIQELRRRLRERKTDDETEIEKRLRRLNKEYEKSKYFDYVIINDDLNMTVSQIEDIIQKHQREAQHVSK